MLTRALALAALALAALALAALALALAATSLGAIPPPATAAPPAGSAPDSAPACPSPPPDRTPAPTDTSPPLALAPFRIQASQLTLHQVDLLHSNKTVSVPTRHGPKRVLRFLTGTAEITGLHLNTAPNSPSLTLTTPPDNTSRLTGPITLYVEKLCGTLSAGPLGIGFGTPGALLPPITPATPPPAVLPDITFTHVTAYLAGLSSTQLHLPNAQLSAT